MSDSSNHLATPEGMDPESWAIIQAFVNGRIPIDRYEDLFGQVLLDAKCYVAHLEQAAA